MSARALTRLPRIDLRPLAARIYGVVRQIPNVVVFVAITLGGGLGASWYMIEQGSPLTTRTYGAWSVWTGAGRSDTDPYTRAHYIRHGMLAGPSTLVEVYFARTDSAGQVLRADCDYNVYGADPDAVSWSLAAFTATGDLIANEAKRYAYNSSTIMRGAGPRFLVTLSEEAQPGNWLPLGGAGNVTLTFTIHEPRAHVSDDSGIVPSLPTIEQVRCR